MDAKNPNRSSTPRVSVGVPVFNGEDYLAAALDSLLTQTYTDFEMIISDNASTDGTRAICEDYSKRDGRVRYYRQPTNLGAAPNFNRTFELASGEYFRWHAHDDVCGPTFLEKCVASLDAAPEAVLCISRTRFIDEGGRPLRDYEHPLNLQTSIRSERFLQFVLPGHIVVEAFGLIRSDVLRKTPLIASYMGSDLVLLGELGLYGPFIEIPEFLFFHREHSKRSVHAHRDAESRTAWFDTRKAGSRVFPSWRLLMEHMVSLGRVPMPLGERIRLALGILRVGNWRRAQLKDELLAGLLPSGSRAR